MTQFDISADQRAALTKFQTTLTDAVPGILDCTTIAKFFALCDAWKEVREIFSLNSEDAQ